MNMIETFAKLRRAGVPLVLIESADAADTVRDIVAVTESKNVPVGVWDLVRGINPATKLAQEICDKVNGGQDAAIATGNPVEALRAIAQHPNLVTVMMGAEKILADSQVQQAVWNLRDIFKGNGSTLALIATMGTKVPASLKDDIVSVTHALPVEDDLRRIVTGIGQDANVAIGDDAVTRAIDATLGLSGFAAEQSVSLALSKAGLDLDDLWERKCRIVEQTQGLKVLRGREMFADIGGCMNVKKFLANYIKGKRRPRVVIFIDEIEKALGSQSDTSGTSQALLGYLLKWSQDTAATGCIFLGPAGSGKSAVSKAIGNEARCPALEFDLSGMRGSLVGESEQRMRAGLATVDAIGQGRVLMIATCNSINALPPELRRRFTLGTFYFDLPSREERGLIWPIHEAKCGVSGPRPNDEGWTGAEIRQCCDIADRLGISLVEAAAYVVPIARSCAEQIETLRKSASGRFLSASEPGVYQYQQQAPVNAGRKLEVQ